MTVMSTIPADPEGLTAVISVGETSVTLVAALAPKSTIDGEEKLVPVMVTDVPPAVDPAVGLTELTVGSDT